MNQGNPYSQYRQNAVVTANPAQMGEMMYGGIVKFLRQAVDHMEHDNMQEAHNSIIRAQDIFEYLAETLNEKVEIAFNLAHLYDYAYRRLIEANIKKDQTIVQEILLLTEELRETWKEARMNLASASGNSRAERPEHV
jgi:flagellar protein FliS